MEIIHDFLKINDIKKTVENISKFIKEEVGDFGKKGTVVGLSGGIDSAVTAALCAKTFG